MSQFFAACRIVIGLSLVAGGATLAAPLAVRLARCLDRPPVGASSQPGFTPDASGGVRPVIAAVAAGPAASAPPPDPNPEPVSADHEFLPRSDYVPPPAPAALPAVAEPLSDGSPAIPRTYRSALDTPPPPLLDAERPPPPVGWMMASGPSVAGRNPVPASHRVADGDDLAGIATRFYGHPGAAGAIWAANRDRIADPALLPIGIELVLPAAGSFPAGPVVGEGTPRAIEPGAAVASSPPSPPATQPASWLGPPASAAPAAAVRPATVVVAPGETLTSIAMRWYRDPAAGRRIWDANRDRLRSPELVVPGMELRLP